MALPLLLLGRPVLAAAPALEIAGLPDGRFRIAWSAAEVGFALEASLAVGLGAAWSQVPEAPAAAGGAWTVTVTAGARPRFFRLVQITAAPARIVETSPAEGETGVSVNRETVFRFDAPLAGDTVLNTALVSAQAAGRALLTRVELATDRRSAALFYLEPLPSGTRVTARFDGFGVLDATGHAFDADADGLPGGVRAVTFTTANATPIGDTVVRGRVFASEKNPDGTDRPLPGVTITVDGAEQTLRAVTAADGSFVLQPAPAGRFFVHVDGRTSPLSQWPGGAYYPFVGKTWEAEPGRTNNLANGDGQIFLPLVPADALRPVSASTTTIVTFAPSLLAANPALAGVEIRVPPNALFADDGTRGGQLGLAPVAPDRLPEPLPPGLNLPLVITIQTDGPSNFDRPVPVRFPNLPDPVTGEVLPPGARTALWSFDHDTGRWEIAGPMTITADGRFAETDPGVGVRQPGWHGAAPGSPGGGPEGEPDDEESDDCEDANYNGLCDDKEPDPCELQKLQMMFSFTDTFTGLLGLLPDVKGAAANCALAFTTSTLQGIRDCGIDPANCWKTDDLSTVTTKLIDFGIGCASNFTGPLKPWADSAVALKSLLDSGLAYRNYRDCRIMNPRTASLHGPGLASVAPGNPFLLQYEFEIRLGAFLDVLYGPGWRFIPLAEVPLLGGLLEGIRDAAAANSPGGFAITPAERDAILARPRPADRSAADVEALITRFQVILPGGDPAGFDLVGVEAAAASLQAVLDDLVADGWQDTYEGYFRGLAILQQLIASAGRTVVGGGAATHGPQPAADDLVVPGLPDRAHVWWLVDLNRGLVRRGRLNASGRFEGLILAPNTDYLVGYADPLTGRAGVNQFRSANAGRLTTVPGAVMAGPPAVPDRDADGLSDFAELIVGTNADAPDTDGDGVVDGAEFRAGGQPLGAEPLPLGVIGGVDTPGEARDLAVDGDLAVVVDGTAGLALFDLSDPRSPVRVAQFALSRPAAAALSGGLALVGQGNGATLLDVRSPETPLVVTNFPGAAANAVALASPYGYFSRGSDVLPVDLATGTLLPAVGLPATVHEFAVDGDLLHVLTVQALHIFRRSGSDLTELSRTPVSGSAAPLEPGRKLFVGGGRAYIGYFQGFTILDVTDPAAPVVLATQPRTQAAIHDLADNGSGLLAAITSFGGETSLAFSLYDVASGTSTTNFLTSLATPGDPFAVVLHHGFAYVADDEAGLQVVNYLPRDTSRQRPDIAFGPPLGVATSLEAGSSPLLTFPTGDDVAVREVELYVNGQRLAAAGSFPFQLPVTVAPPVAGQTSVVLRARAVDTGGNERWTDEFSVTITPDQTPPAVRLLSPAAGVESPPGGLTVLLLGFSEPMNPASFAVGLRITAAGPDGALGTADDPRVEAASAYDAKTRTLTLRREPAFGSERYRLTATTNLADASGVALSAPRAWDFRVLPPAASATTPVNNSTHRPGGPTHLTARFSTLMDAASLRAGGFLLDHAGPDGQVGTADDVPVDVSALTFSAVSNWMIFTPAPPLRSGRYRARVTTNALDVVGSRVAAPPAPWNFTVLSPSVTAVEPPDGHARPVGGLAELHARFTDPMDPATLAASLQLALTNGTPVLGGTASFDSDTLTATLAFPAPLAGGEYRLRVTTSVTDVYGNPLASEFTSRFGVHGPVTWAVDADGRWDGAGNWSPARPVPGDDVVLDRPARDVVVSHTTGSSLVNTLTGTETLRVTGGNLAIQSNSAFAGPLALQGGVLSNRANLRLSGPVTFGANATVRGDGTMIFAGPVSLQGGTSANSVGIGGQTLVVEGGPLTWTAGNLEPDGRPTNAHWVIGPGAVFEAVAGATQRDWQHSRATLWNRGLFRQTGGDGLLRWLGLNVTNDGVWEITAGQAELQGSLTQSGRLALAPGTSLRISEDNGTVRLLPGGVIEGAGALSFRRTDATFAGRYAVTGGSTFESMAASFTGEFLPGDGPLTFINTDAVLDTGPLALDNTVTLREGTLDFRHPTTLGDFRWEFGRVRTAGDLTVDSRLVIGSDTVGNGAQFAGPGRLRVNDGLVLRRVFLVETNAVLEHAGTSVWQPQTSAQSTALDLDPGAVFRNLANGRFELATNRTIGGPGTFENLGTLVKAANALTNILSTVLESPGAIELAGGTLQLSGGGTLGGPVSLAAGTTLDITSAGQRPGWLLSGTFTGGGRLLLRGASNHLTGPLGGPMLLVNGATVRLPAEFSLTNAEIRSGTLHLDGPLRLTGTNSILTGSNTRIRGPGLVRNDGNLQEASAWFDGDIENAGDWTYTTRTRPRYGGLFRNLPGATYTVTNLTSSPSDGPDSGVFDNAGLLRQAGPGNARLVTTVTNRGVIEITDTLTVGGAFTQTAEGLTRLHGGTLSLAGTWRALAGEIHGPGIVGRNSGGEFYVLTNTAHLRPGGPAGYGVLEFDATATHLGPDSLLDVRIGGSTTGTEHDQLRGNGSLWLGGQLRLDFVPGFTPELGQKFLIVSAASRARTFRSTFEVTGLPAGLAVRLNYLSNGVEAELVSGP